MGPCKSCREYRTPLKGAELHDVIYILQSCLCGEWFMEGQSRQMESECSEEELSRLEWSATSEEKNQHLDFWFDQYMTWMDVCAIC